MTPATTNAARALITGLLSRLHTGRLEVSEPDGTLRRFGPGGGPAARVHVRDDAVWARLLRGSRGLAESYADGLWDSDDLVAVVRVAARNADGLDRLRRRMQPLRVPYQRLCGVRGRNTAARSRAAIHAHYDLGNALFERMLDPSMMYSAAVFRTPDTPLHEAALAKLDLVCDKLGLGPEDHVLEIGTGWGGFAVHAAATRGCRVTTTTISREQHAFARRRVREAGLAGRVEVLLRDYRELEGRYDALVSLEMVEAVGWRDFPTFFATCADRLRPEGAMLLQAITIDDRAYSVEKASRSFIRTHVFPGGCLPSQAVIADNVARHTPFQLASYEDLTSDYVLSLRHWRANVEARAGELDGLGYDERFRRLWRMYLCYCEAGFTERRIGVGQHLLVGPQWRGRAPRTAVGAPAGRLEALAS